MQFNYSQNLKEQFNNIYGLDNKLYNGFVYSDNFGSFVKGNPFINDEFGYGSLVLDSNRYQNILLNYDIYNQVLVLKFHSSIGAELMIEIPFFKVSEFTINEDVFRIIPQSDGTYKVYQIIGNESFKLWVTHKKNLNIENVSQQYKYQFSRDFIQVLYKKQYGEFIELKSNKDLISLQESDKQTLIKKWLRKNKIKIHKSNPDQLKLVSQYLNQL